MTAPLHVPPPGSLTPTPPSAVASAEPWTTEDARELYLIDRWGGGYFGVSEDGKLTVAPLAGKSRQVAVVDVVEAAIREEGLKAPLIIRFQDMLHHRVRV